MQLHDCKYICNYLIAQAIWKKNGVAVQRASKRASMREPEVLAPINRGFPCHGATVNCPVYIVNVATSSK